MLLYLLGISPPFHLVWIAMSGVGFLYSAGCGSFFLWRFYPVGGVRRLACQGFLVREACVSVLACGDGFLLSGLQWSAQ